MVSHILPSLSIATERLTYLNNYRGMQLGTLAQHVVGPRFQPRPLHFFLHPPFLSPHHPCESITVMIVTYKWHNYRFQMEVDERGKKILNKRKKKTDAKPSCLASGDVNSLGNCKICLVYSKSLCLKPCAKVVDTEGMHRLLLSNILLIQKGLPAWTAIPIFQVWRQYIYSNWCGKDWGKSSAWGIAPPIFHMESISLFKQVSTNFCMHNWSCDYEHSVTYSFCMSSCTTYTKYPLRTPE